MTQVATSLPLRGARWALPVPGRASTVVGWTAVAATVATDAISLLPGVHLAYHAPGAHGSLEAAAALIGGLAAYLTLGRFRRSRLLGDLVLASGLAVLALANACTVFDPASPERETSIALLWLSAAFGTGGAVLFAAAALVPARVVREVRRGEHRAAAALLAGVGALAIVLVSLRGVLPVAVEPGVSPSSATSPQLVGHPAMLAVQVVGLALFTLAAFGFTRRAGRTGDDFLRWLGVAAVLGAAAKANYTLYPSLYSEWVYSGDAFRLLFWLVILGAMAQQIRLHWEQAAEVAVLEERRRLARDLHDGLAQELAYVLRSVRRLDAPASAVAQISTGVGRALDESRRAIAALTEPLDGPFAATLEQAAQRAAARTGARARLEIEPGLEVPREAQEALVRIVSEAVTNAGLHAGVPLVNVTCSRRATPDGERIVLRVSDAGSGFDAAAPDAARRGRFGLVAMRERADGIGAQLALRSAPGAGTTVEVLL